MKRTRLSPTRPPTSSLERRSPTRQPAMAAPPGQRRLARRGFLESLLAAAAAPLVVPARVLGAEGAPGPSGMLGLGVIGVGAQGRHDLGGFLQHKDVRVTGLCDINRQHLAVARKMVADAYGRDDVKVFADFRELIAAPSTDAVLAALPVHWHSLPAIAAALAGKHLFLEKPMAMSFEEARRMRAAVRRTGVVFQFGTQQRSDPKFRRACELALSGRLGALREIHVSAPAGRSGPLYPAQPVPGHVDWERWVGPAPWTPFHEQKLIRDVHEHISNFSLGMISCWGIHHLDIAQWGNGADDLGPRSVEGHGQFPTRGSLDTILTWNVRFEYANAAPIVFVSDGTPGFDHGVKFVGASAWVHVRRGALKASSDTLEQDPGNRPEALPVRLPESRDHTRNFVDAVRHRRRAISDIGAAVRGDSLCQLALIAVKRRHKLAWDPAAERFLADDAANAMLQPRPFRGEWRLPEV
ncbi:MAG: Gfo/Idh/MocA family oxidoreductase [Verrucomicrobia bacterium]|nr:Gfo/Idh/MocA family oxidoreductase [Verrucomicrobiota bacterium]